MLYTILNLMTLAIVPPFAHADRQEPKAVKPVVRHGLRYEVPHVALDNKMKHNGGYVRVVNARDGSPICTKQVYETKYDKNFELDNQDNFITSLTVVKNVLAVTSENLPVIKIPLAGFCD